MRVRFHPAAAIDLQNAALHYAGLRRQLGLGFYRHIDGLPAEIARAPTVFRIYRAPGFRRHFRPPFPYAVVYVVRADEIWVLAVMHFKQPPDYWLRRSKG